MKTPGRACIRSPITFCCTTGASGRAWTIRSSRFSKAANIRCAGRAATRPIPLSLSIPLAEVLACGGELKNTLCLTKDRYAILSQHIGDLENLETHGVFPRNAGASAALLPRFAGSRRSRSAPELSEHPLRAGGIRPDPPSASSIITRTSPAAWRITAIEGQVIGVALDGTGYGTDGKIWGGEFLVCDFRGFERRGHLRYIPLAGGDSAVRQPWRSALAYLRDTFGERASSFDLPLFRDIPPKQIRVVDNHDRARHSNRRDFLLRPPLRRRLVASRHPARNDLRRTSRD